jgi:multidrug efflux pump subunit AcrB
VVLVLGLFFVDRLPVNLLPEVEFPLVRITVNYPGVAPEVMEEQVTRVLERNLSSVENLAGISSRASEGRTNVNLIFEHGIDLDIAMQNAARQLEVARQQLPSDIQPPRLRKWDPGEWAIWRAGFSSPTREPREVRDWVEQRLVPQLAVDQRRGLGGGRRRPGARDRGGARPGSIALLPPDPPGCGRSARRGKRQYRRR